jgi:hypothetical protein
MPPVRSLADAVAPPASAKLVRARRRILRGVDVGTTAL